LNWERTTCRSASPICTFTNGGDVEFFFNECRTSALLDSMPHMRAQSRPILHPPHHHEQQGREKSPLPITGRHRGCDYRQRCAEVTKLAVIRSGVTFVNVWARTSNGQADRDRPL
jgi:hypothetical protein